MQSSAIRVGARLYSIVSLDDENFDILLSQKNVHDSAIKSFVDYDEQLIVIRDRLSQEHKQELVLHELLHACAEDAGISQDQAFETFVGMFSPRLNDLVFNGLFSVLRDVTKSDKACSR
jgi:microcystin degradation protein MlrC